MARAVSLGSPYVWQTRETAIDSGPSTYAELTHSRPVVPTRFDATLEPVRRGAVSGQGRAPGFTETHFDETYYRHSDVPWADEMNGGVQMLAFIRNQIRKGLTIPVFRAVQGAGYGPYGRQNPYIERINLDRQPADSYGAAVDARTAGMVSYGY